MYTVRQQFTEQCKQAYLESDCHQSTLDVVMVTHRARPTRISILGDSISRAAYQIWRSQGSNVRLLCVYQNGVRIHNSRPSPGRVT